MAKLLIEIDVDFDNKELKKVNKGLDDIEKNAKKSQSGLKRLEGGLDALTKGFGALAGAAVAFQQAFELAEQGAQLQRLERNFATLAGTIDTTADSLLNNLRGATAGLVSDADLIASATDIINLGLGKTEDEVVRLATVISTLGLDMQQVILTFANNSVARLDALGLSIETVQTKARALEAQGLDADKAFDTAVLEALEDKMALVGGAVDDNAAAIQRFRVSLEELQNKISIIMATGLTPWIRLLNGEYTPAVKEAALANKELADSASGIEKFVFGIQQQLLAVDLLRESYEKGAITLGQFLHRRIEMAKGEKSYADIIRISTRAIDDQTRMTAQNIAMTQKAPGVYDDTSDSVEQLSFAGNSLVEQYAKAGKEIRDTARDALWSFRRIEKPVAKGISGFEAFTEKIEDLGSKTFFVTNRTKDQSKSLAELNQEQKRILENIRSLESGTAGLGLTEDELNDKLQTQRERLEDVNAAIAPLSAVGGRLTTVTKEAIVDSDKLNQAFLDSVIAQDASTESIVGLGVALGIYTEDQAEAILKAEILKQGIENIAKAFVDADGEMTFDQAQRAIQALINGLDQIPEEMNVAINVAVHGGAADLLREFGRGVFQPSDDRPNQSTTNIDVGGVSVTAPMTPSMGNNIASEVANRIGQASR